jgi:hypothetical protein
MEGGSVGVALSTAIGAPRLVWTCTARLLPQLDHHVGR